MKSHLDTLRATLTDRFGDQEGLKRFEKAMLDMKIERFVQDTPEEERASRLFGRPQHLIGLVCKNFDKDKHVIRPFEIPTDWPVVATIDVHPSKPMAVGFYATDPRGFRYVIDEIYANMDPETLGEKIVRKKIQHLWRFEEAYVDPLAKGDEKFAKNRLGDVDSSFVILENILIRHGILLQTATKDRDGGVIAINRGLKSLNNMPSLFFFNTVTRHLWEIQRWVYDKNGSANAPDMHMMENLYRFMILDVQYVPPVDIHGKRQHTDKGVV